MTMDVMMQKYRMQMISTLTNQIKDQANIHKNLWVDIMRDLVHAVEAEDEVLEVESMLKITRFLEQAVLR